MNLLKPRIVWLAALVCLLTLSFAVPEHRNCHAIAGEKNGVKLSLAGIEKVCLKIEPNDPVFKRTGVKRRLIVKSVRRHLLDAGLKLATIEEVRKSRAEIPMLVLNYQTLELKSNSSVTSIFLRLVDSARLSRSKDKQIMVTTWSGSKLMVLRDGEKSRLLTHSLNLIDRFTRDWKGAN